MQNHRAARGRQGAHGTPYAVGFLQFGIKSCFANVLPQPPGSLAAWGRRGVRATPRAVRRFFAPVVVGKIQKMFGSAKAPGHVILGLGMARIIENILGLADFDDLA